MWQPFCSALVWSKFATKWIAKLSWDDGNGNQLGRNLRMVWIFHLLVMWQVCVTILFFSSIMHLSVHVLPPTITGGTTWGGGDVMGILRALGKKVAFNFSLPGWIHWFPFLARVCLVFSPRHLCLRWWWYLLFVGRHSFQTTPSYYVPAVVGRGRWHWPEHNPQADDNSSTLLGSSMSWCWKLCDVGREAPFKWTWLLFWHSWVFSRKHLHPQRCLKYQPPPLLEIWSPESCWVLVSSICFRNVIAFSHQFPGKCTDVLPAPPSVDCHLPH